MANCKYLFMFVCIGSCVYSIEVNTEAEPSTWSNKLEGTVQGVGAAPSTRSSKLEGRVQGAGAAPSSGGNGLTQVLQGPGAAVSLLLDIRDLLAGWSRPPPPTLRQEEPAWRPALEDHRKTTDQTVELLSDSVERVSSGVTQKVELIMESFAALKMLVQVQEAQLVRLQSMLEKVQGKTDNLDDQSRDFRLSLEALQTRSIKQDHKSPSDLSGDVRNPEEFNNRWLFIEDVNTNKTDSIKSTEKSEEESSTEKDLKTCLHDVKNEVESLKIQIQNIDINTTSSGHREQNTVYQSNPNGLENIVNNLERIQTQQQVSLEAVNYKVAMVDDLVLKIENIDNMTSLHSYKMSEMQDTITNLNSMKGDMGSIKKDVADVKDTVTHAMSNITDLNKDMEHMENNMNTKNMTISVMKKGLCVHPYLRGAGGCFYVHTGNRLGWNRAREHCRTLQGDLAAPGNYTSFKNYLLSKRLTRSYTYWLGASDTVDEGVWQWVDGRKVDMGTSIWQSGQPNEGTQSNCMEVKPAYKYVAADVTCKAQNYFICEQER